MYRLKYNYVILIEFLTVFVPNKCCSVFKKKKKWFRVYIEAIFTQKQ